MLAIPTESIGLEAGPTEELLAWAEAIEASGAATFEKARQLATRLGARVRPDGLVEIGFWTPELSGGVIQPKNIVLEVFTPQRAIDPALSEQSVCFRRHYVQLRPQGDYHWGCCGACSPAAAARSARSTGFVT